MRRFQSGRRLMMKFIGLLTCFYPFLFLESFFCCISLIISIVASTVLFMVTI